MASFDGWADWPLTAPPVSLLAQLLLLSLVSALSFAVPFLVTPSDVFTRRAVLSVECALSLAGGLLLSSSLLWALASSLSLQLDPSASVLVRLNVSLLSFGCGLLTPPLVERSLLLTLGVWVRRRRLAAAAAEAEAALEAEQAAVDEAARAYAQGRGSYHQSIASAKESNGRIAGAASSSRSVAAATTSLPAKSLASARSQRGRTADVLSPLLPPPVRDYRSLASAPLDAVSDGELDVDLLDDTDQLSPAAPLTAHSSLSASYSSYYQQPISELDALTFINERRFIARCLFCKEAVATRKGLAYHAAGRHSCRTTQHTHLRYRPQRAVPLTSVHCCAACSCCAAFALLASVTGCQLKPLPAFTVASHSLAALRGRRQLTLDDGRIPHWVLICIALSEHALVQAVAGVAASVSLQSSALSAQLTAALALAAFSFLSALSVGLLLRQCRVSSATAYAAGALIAAPLPLSTLVSAVGRGWLSAPLLVCAYGWLGGALCWHGLVDCVLEEMERREARVKWLLAACGGICIAALNIG